MAETYTGRTLREILRIVLSRFLGMVLIFAFVVAAVVVASLWAPKWYRSEAQLMARPTSIGTPLAEKSTSQRESVSLFVTTQRQIILSDTVLAAALMMLENPQWVPKATPDKVKEFKLPPALLRDLPNFITNNSEKVRSLASRVSVITPGGPDATFTQIFKIRVDWPEPTGGEFSSQKSREVGAADCQKITEYVVYAYLARFQELEERQAQGAEDITDAAMKESEKRLAETQKALADMAQQIGEDLLPVASIVGNQGIDSGAAAVSTELSRKITEADARIAELTAMKVVLEKELKKEPSAIAVPDEVTQGNVVISALQQKIVDLKLRLNNLTPQYTDNYQELETTRKELTAAQQDLRDEIAKQYDRTLSSLDIKTAERNNLQTRLAKFQEDMKRIGGQAVKYDGLQKAQAAAIENFQEEQKKYYESLQGTSLAKRPFLVTVVDDATRPNANDPRRPILWLNVLIACVAGLVLALVYAFLADHFDHTIKSVDDAERYLGSPVLASVPKIGRRIFRSP